MCKGNYKFNTWDKLYNEIKKLSDENSLEVVVEKYLNSEFPVLSKIDFTRKANDNDDCSIL